MLAKWSTCTNCDLGVYIYVYMHPPSCSPEAAHLAAKGNNEVSFDTREKYTLVTINAREYGVIA